MTTIFTGIFQSMYDCSIKMVLTTNVYVIFMLGLKTLQTLIFH